MSADKRRYRSLAGTDSRYRQISGNLNWSVAVSNLTAAAVGKAGRRHYAAQHDRGQVKSRAL
jgi:hypothetical protein